MMMGDASVGVYSTPESALGPSLSDGEQYEDKETKIKVSLAIYKRSTFVFYPLRKYRS